MASQYDGDDGGNLIENDKIYEFYDRFNNEVDESLAEEEEGIVKASSSFVFGKTSQLRYYPLINRGENLFRYNQKQQKIFNQKHQPNYRSLGSSVPSSGGGGGGGGGGAAAGGGGEDVSTGVILRIPSKSKQFSNSLYKNNPGKIVNGKNFDYIKTIKRFKNLEAITNDNNNYHHQFKTDTSISGFKNYTSTNYDQKEIKKESNIEPKHTKNKRLFETNNHQNKDKQLHSHQTRSIIEGGSLQQQNTATVTATGGSEEAIGSSRSGVSIEKVELSWIEPTLPLTPVLVLSIFGIVICAIFIIFWIKNIIFNSYKRRNKDNRINDTVNRNCQIYQKEGQHFIEDKFKVMDDDPKTNDIIDNHQLNDNNGDKYKFSDSDDDYDYDQKVVDNKIIDEFHSNFDSLTIEQTPKNDVLLVDKRSSPIVLEQIGENDSHRHFIFTTTPAALTSSSVQQTIDLNSSIFGNCNNRLTGIVPVAAVPIPVPVPLPIPIPVPIPVVHQQQACRGEKSYQDHNNIKNSGPSRPLLIKSSSITSSGCLTSLTQTTPQLSRSRRFSLCERRSHSPQATFLNAPHQQQQQQQQQQQHPKAQSISRLSQRDWYDYDDFCHNNQISDTNPTNSGIIQKSFDTHSRTDDKENEIPAGGEVYSPKMKLSEQVLAQQNSPRSFNESPAGAASSTVMRFTFSPKQILANSENGSSSSSSSNNNNNNNNNNINNSASPPVHQTYSGAICHQSPLLNSAVYKHGNYFKFPEVDCLTPDKVGGTSVQPPLTHKPLAQPPPLLALRRFNQNSLESHPSSDESAAASSSGSSSPPPKMKPSPATLTTPPVSQATRRARLKSISLDSDGARLVEDNLGIPVEEIIERTNQSPIIDDDCFVFEDTDKNQEKVQCSESTSHGTNGKNYFIITDETDQKMSEPEDIDTVDGGNNQKRFHAKNKNHLTITIGPDLSEGSPNSESGDDFSGDSVKLTPKTPTLTQTKQKAISLDSSDTTNIIYCLPSSGNIDSSQNNRANSDSPKTSLLQISSISVPTTPKRQQLLLSSPSVGGMGRKLQSTKGNKNRLISTTSKIGFSKSSTSTPSTSFDHDVGPQKPQGFITKLRSFNENTLDDGFYDDGQFYLEPENDMMVVDKRATNLRNREFSGDLDDEQHVQGQNFAGSSSNLLGANIQNQKCTTSLSLSNNNLKTLPEVMTISDFSTDTQESHNLDDDKKTVIKSTPSPGGICNTTSGQGSLIGVAQKTPRNSILQRRGSNHSLTLNLNGSLGNLTKSLSVSNYSLGSTNLQTSQCNLSGSSHNLSHHQHQQQQQQKQQKVSGSIGTPSQIIGVPQGSVGGPTTNVCGLGGSKKNLLQRRGSNTSLTLNIKGSSCMNLNRFNSHSSLNISSMQHQSHPHQVQQHHHQQQQQQQHVQTHQLGTLGGGGGGGGGGGSGGPGGCTKKGLLERRNSNASLTLNIQNRALSISNCNLRGSACSLSSVNTNPMDYDGTLIAEHHNEDDNQQQYDLHYPNSAKHRKFLSSENLNSITQCSKLNQTHVRNSTKTCFGSVSDLKPHQLVQQKVTNQNIQNINREFDGIQQVGEQQQQKHHINTFGESNLCSCTGVRNITTKPLSPQSTSEDFKMYLANIQLLQNATNVLNDEHLRKLSYIFEKSYNMTSYTIQSDKNDDKLEIRATSITATSTIDDQCINDDIIDITINFEAPNDDEQKLLLRNLHQEFWDLPTNYQEKPLVFGSQAKNRYKTILPNEHSRVILDSEPGFIQEPYINANYIKGPDYTQNSYIATQGPMSNTIYEYWLMIYQNVAKFNSIKTSINTMNRTIIEENAEMHKNDQTLDIDNTNNSDDNIKNDMKMILKSKTPTNDTIPNKNTFTSDHSYNNSKSKGCNSGKFNQKIVMLTNFVENNRQKCSIYFPIDSGKIILITNTNDKIDSGDLIQFYENYFNKIDTDSIDDIIKNRNIIIDNIDIRKILPKSNYFIIRNCGIVKMNGYSIRKLQCIYCPLINNSDNHNYYEFYCNHYWFPDWPDHRSPNDIDVLLDMSLHLLDNRCDDEFYNYKINNEIIQQNSYVDNQPLPVIHCSAGIGRTGCLAAILNGLQQMRASLVHLNDANLLKRNNINVDVLGIVCNLRLQRGGMVQNSEQYELIHRALCLYLKRLDFEKTDNRIDEISEDISSK